MSPALPMSLDTMVGLTVERFRSLCRPVNKEPSPIRAGGTPAEWAALAGLTGHTPAEEIRLEHPSPLDCGLYDPSTVAHRALQKLCMKADVDRLPGVPMRYRPRMV